jgi:hypothetical protein
MIERPLAPGEQERSQEDTGERMAMGRRMRMVLAAVAAFVAVAVGVSVFGRMTFERRIEEETASLLSAAQDHQPAAITSADLARLPEPVQRWLQWAGVVGQKIPRSVRLTQEGRFRMGEGRPWVPFTAEEFFTTDPLGFIWKTQMQMYPLVEVIGRDRYIDGSGSIEMRLLGVVPVANASGPELNQGALLRYLNETMWFPAAALSPSISWEAVDATSARATITDSGLSVSAVFIFDAEGRPIDMVADRYDLGRGQIERWSTPLTDWGEFSDVRVPVGGMALWRYDTGDFPYIELRITDIAYDAPVEPSGAGNG